MRRTTAAAIGLLLFAPGIASPADHSREEAALRQYFQGRTVVVRVDMPATQKGVDVRPGTPAPVDVKKVSGALGQHGVGIPQGAAVPVTKVVVKSDHVELQLAGGGFGTFGDVWSLPSSTVASYASKTKVEEDLEDRLKYTKDSATRKRIKRDLDELREQREVANAAADAANAQAAADAEAVAAERRAMGGSRFNIRYDDGYPPGALTPEGVMQALAPYVDFDEDPAPAAPLASAPPDLVAELQNGMTVLQVEQILGPASGVVHTREGTLDATQRTYVVDGRRLTTTFVGGVLVRY
jgi:hypothetical protein